MTPYLISNNKSLCTGCRACELRCPKNAIEMQYDEEGFLYPVLNENICIRCGICVKTCPINHKLENNSEFTPIYIGAWAKSIDYLKSCSTGGICSLIAEQILSKKGKVFGVVLDAKTHDVYHCLINNTEEQRAMRGSKYVQSDVKRTYYEAKLLLDKGVLVYYTGTPCQIAGLKGYLKKDYDNLITTDLICHGVFSKIFFDAEYNMYCKWYGKEINNFKFRSKRHFPWYRGGVINFDVKGRHVERYAKYSPMYYAYTFAKNKLNLRYSCYNCKYRTISNREGDIMVGDYWGGSKLYPEFFSVKRKKYGISLVKINSRKGYRVFKEIEEKIEFFTLSEDDACQQPDLKGIKRDIPQERYYIYQKIMEQDYEKYAAEFMKEPYFKYKGIFDYYLQFVKNMIMGSPLYPLINKIRNHGNN